MLSAQTIADIDCWYDKRKSSRGLLRVFYYSPKRMKRRRTCELQKQKYIDRLCSKGREYVSSSENTIPIMFVGDRGYGIGSVIKGHSRQGGVWKPQKHSLYTSVCITNEHNTSQTCLFCLKNFFIPLQLGLIKLDRKKSNLSMVLSFATIKNVSQYSQQKMLTVETLYLPLQSVYLDFLPLCSELRSLFLPLTPVTPKLGYLTKKPWLS